MLTVGNQSDARWHQGSIQTTTGISHDLTQNNELTFLSMENLQFYHFSNTEIACFAISAYVLYKKSWYESYFKKSDIESSRQDLT